MTKLFQLVLVALAPITTIGFTPISSNNRCSVPQFLNAQTCNLGSSFVGRKNLILFAESKTDESAAEAVFLAPDESKEHNSDSDREISLDQVESIGKGAAKKKRGRRGSSKKSESTAKAAATLEPEEIFYEGPPAITETLIPTVSILTVIGIIPAAASWARQAWVRYKITSRRVRVNSGVNGKDMAEIVYPDITEIRTVKRLLGDGDVVFFLTDGAKFEMRNVPKFEETMEFILKQVRPEVAKVYKDKGDVTEG